MCQRKWFDKRYDVKIGSALFDEFWAAAKRKYNFIADTVQETMTITGLNVIQLKFFLEGTVSKGRSVKLMDTSAKTQSLYSTITRIFWESIKIRSHKTAETIQSLLDVRSAIFSVINFPYKSLYKTFLIKEILRNAKVFDLDDGELPPQAQGLRLFKDILMNKISRELAVHEIVKMKEGSIGWFSVRQGYSREEGGRFGPGEWRGRLGSVSVILILDGKFVKKIILSTLLDLDQTIINLNNLMKDMRLKLLEVPQMSKDSFYFCGRKGINRSSNIMKDSAPVEVDTTFKIDRFDSIEKTNWDFETTPYNVRLVNVDGVGNKAILYSERFSLKDWDKDSDWPLDKDSIIHYWHKGAPLPLNKWKEFSKDLNSLNVAGRDFFSHVRYLRKSSSHCSYDLIQFGNVFNRYWTGFGSEAIDRAKFIEFEDRREQVDLSQLGLDIEDFGLFQSLNEPETEWGTSAIDLVNENLASHDIDGLDYTMPDQEVMDTLKTFTDSSDAIPSEILAELHNSMSINNSFFSIINNMLSNMYPNIGLENLLVDNTPLDDLFGEIFSYLSGKDKRYLDELDIETNKYDTASQVLSEVSGISQVSSVGRQKDMITELTRIIPSAGGDVLDMLQRVLRKEQRKLDMMERRDVNVELDENDLMDLDKRKVTILLLKTLSDSGEDFIEKQTVIQNEDVYWLRVLSKLYEHIESAGNLGTVTEDIFESWLSSVGNPHSSKEYWDLLSDVLGYDICFELNGRIIWKEVYHNEPWIELSRSKELRYSIHENVWKILDIMV